MDKLRGSAASDWGGNSSLYLKHAFGAQVNALAGHEEKSKDQPSKVLARFCAFLLCIAVLVYSWVYHRSLWSSVSDCVVWISRIFCQRAVQHARGASNGPGLVGMAEYSRRLHPCALVSALAESFA